MTASIWAVVPAAGIGRRMGGGVPKQYLALDGRTVLEHALDRLLDHPRVRGVAVAVARGDERFATLAVAQRVHRVDGGAERADSVLSALAALEAHEARSGDWVLVHDAVRPCLQRADLDALIDAVLAASSGGLLAAPVRDTIKRVRAGEVVETVPRDGLWHALTPQMFPLAALRAALESARTDGVQVTDEAQAMERAGGAPLVVEGRADNVKITRPDDLALAALILARAGSGARVAC